MPKTVNSLCGAFCAVLAAGLLVLKLWLEFPLPSFVLFGLAFLGLGISLFTRFRLHQKSPWDLVAYGVGIFALIWILAESLL
jgi:hypothetical protein